MSCDPIYLQDYVPRSELVVKRRKIAKPKFPVIDAHAHFGPLVLGDRWADLYDTEEEVEKLRAIGIRHIVNAETLWGKELDVMLEKIRPYKDFIITFGSVDISRLGDPDFARYVNTELRQSKAKAIKGIKLWKNISLGMKDKAGKYIAINDQRLTPIWDTAAELDLPILMHIADPVAFFRPIDQHNERFEELQSHPNWSFHKPGLFSFMDLMEQQEQMIADNPHTTFIIAHGGSYSENLDYVGQCLDRYDNMYVDIAARLAEFGRQPYTARRFFIKYSDRILFGTDAYPGAYDYAPYFEFLETWNEYFPYSHHDIPPQGRWRIYGISLDDDVLEKVYYKNAVKLLGLDGIDS